MGVDSEEEAQAAAGGLSADSLNSALASAGLPSATVRHWAGGESERERERGRDRGRESQQVTSPYLQRKQWLRERGWTKSTCDFFEGGGGLSADSLNSALASAGLPSATVGRPGTGIVLWEASQKTTRMGRTKFSPWWCPNRHGLLSRNACFGHQVH